MTEQEQTRIFTENLKRYMSAHRLTQKEVAEAIGVNPQTFNTWMTGKHIPRMDKIQLLADYFGVRKSDLVDYPEDAMEETLQEAFDRRPDMRILFQLAKNCTPEEINLVARMLEAFQNKN